MRTKFLLAMVAFTAMGGAMLFGPAGFRDEPQSVEATSLTEIRKLLASDAEANDRFSQSVTVSGDTAVVGAFLEDSFGNNAGAAYVYARGQGGADNWGEVQKLTASDADTGDQFGRSVSVSADTAVVGAFFQGIGGAAYVFQRDVGGADNWGEVQKLTASDALVGDRFGQSVAISGDIVVVGASQEDAGGTWAGAVYVFQRDQGGVDNWGEVKKITASDVEAGDFFGWSVSVSGDTLAVGGYGEDTGGSRAGAAYVFQRDEGGVDNWGEVKKLIASDAEAEVEFGRSVAISGNSAIVGARSAEAAYIFERSKGGADNWGEVKKLTASDAQAEDVFGRSVAIVGDTALVGSAGEDTAGFEAGAAYFFQRNLGGADNWGEVKKFTASDAEAGDFFGSSVAISGDATVVGALSEGDGGFHAGAAYVFEQPPPKVVGPGDTDGDGCSNEREFGSDETLGGQRDYLNPWDFFDTNGDQVIDLPNDILGVIQHFAPLGGPPYDVAFDRGHRDGETLWSMTAPDGVIDLPIDILGVIYQFGHNCQ